jgi:hypothetical protein
MSCGIDATLSKSELLASFLHQLDLIHQLTSDSEDQVYALELGTTRLLH